MRTLFYLIASLLVGVGGPGVVKKAGAAPFLMCAAPLPTEQITHYDVFQNGILIGDDIPAEADGSLLMDLDGIAPGEYTFTVEAINLWGNAESCDPFLSPSMPTQAQGLVLSRTPGDNP